MNTLVIAKRELGAFFVSPIAYIVGAAFLFITGLFFVFTVVISNIATLAQVFQVTAVILLFMAPILTMRLLSEEARSGTLELLLTAPVRDWEVVLGKFLATWLFFGESCYCAIRSAASISRWARMWPTWWCSWRPNRRAG